MRKPRVVKANRPRPRIQIDLEEADYRSIRLASVLSGETISQWVMRHLRAEIDQFNSHVNNSLVINTPHNEMVKDAINTILPQEEKQ